MKNINDRQISEIAKSIASKKMTDYNDLTVGDFFADVVRPLIELLGIETLKLSAEEKQAEKIVELEKELEKLKAK